MQEFSEVKLYLSKDVLKEIDTIVNYKKLKDILYLDDHTPRSIEEFITGCVCHYIKAIKHLYDLSGLDDLGRPYRLQNRIKEYMDKNGVSQAMLAERTGILASNLSPIMKNKNQPSLDYFFRVWIALECPPLNKILYRLEE
ncbi:helix-turn-helix domain-containing protein [Bacillus sp. T33-2]|uniref:helix-turn-helix domain-containing protein n=1 Tax=Bacillus sp. T33-2 TaxID=2054168 RepID=UPI000C77E240|nr:helix-turn-helix transcriptional regulator [Bacillus sp. T33-2]PLR99627.1 hypothetical protein CVD19_00770 [Bacillus sp. T33-2]